MVNKAIPLLAFVREQGVAEFTQHLLDIQASNLSILTRLERETDEC